MQNIIFILGIIGTMAFAGSGAVCGISKEMDILGTMFLGCITAVGGGIMRDIMLGCTPPDAFVNPLYIIVSVIVSVVIFVAATDKALSKTDRYMEHIFLVMDSVGLAVFTIVNMNNAYAMGYENNLFLVVFIGVLSGVGGGVLRDVLAGNIPPYIFVKHFYVTSSIIGAVLYILLKSIMPISVAMFFAIISIVTLRICAAYFHWNLPKRKISEKVKSK